MEQLQTKQWRVDPKRVHRYSDVSIREAAALLKHNEVVAFPTETVYGLGGNAFSDEAIKKIFKAKGRPADNPLIVHIAEQSQLQDVVADVPQTAARLIDAFWPGPLTVVLSKRRGISDYATADRSTVAVRMPDHPVARALIKEAAVPVAAPSANRSGKPSPTNAQHVLADLDGLIAGVLDGGDAGIGVESTVVKCTDSSVTILRPGGITTEQIEAIVPVNKQRSSDGANAVTPESPGMKYTHYAPSAPMLLKSGNVYDVQSVVDKARKNGKRVGVLTTEENEHHYQADVILACGKREELETVAANLYATLRQFDRCNVDLIVSETFPHAGIGEAVMNRLAKAARKVE